jgi:hypothetical protein
LNTPEFDAFTNHWTDCPHCRPRYDIYCKTGRELWIDDKAAFIANLETLADRQYFLSVAVKNSPKYIEQIKKRVLEKFEGKKNDVNVW